ncbi:hypothetical protein [Aquimarina sp. I32.4]|uniref:hypothetical protein n=1 Tax=Aquimarina sp. I32.4 TaxID=2053903 RepID=UPI000CDF15EC|nr:hypothetical protein [Aquimarina sp. I32.4]
MKNIKHSSNHLVISVNESTTTDNKQAKSIDKKIKKIEQLNKQIKKITDNINVARKLYNEHCKKEEEKLLRSKEQLIIKLYQRYQQKGFAIWQKELIETKLINEIDSLLSSGYESETVVNIQSEISKFKIENMGDNEKEMMNDLTKEFLKDMGVDIDVEDFSFEDLNDPDFIKQFQEKQSEEYRKEYQEFHQTDTEEKHKAQHEKVKTTNNDFHKLYRDLVKKAHPDLVIDPLEKEAREEWMKKLSKAWEERNYYELLLLQKEINRDDSIDIILNSLQIASLVKELNKTINKLEADKYKLKHYDPETSFYYENFNAKSEKGVLKKIVEHKDYVQFQIEEIEDEKSSLKTQKSTKELLVEIRESQGGYYDDSFEYFDV